MKRKVHIKANELYDRIEYLEHLKNRLTGCNGIGVSKADHGYHCVLYNNPMDLISDGVRVMDVGISSMLSEVNKLLTKAKAEYDKLR